MSTIEKALIKLHNIATFVEPKEDAISTHDDTMRYYEDVANLAKKALFEFYKRNPAGTLSGFGIDELNKEGEKS